VWHSPVDGDKAIEGLLVMPLMVLAEAGVITKEVIMTEVGATWQHRCAMRDL
jgi:hypothetical protein